MAVMRWAIIGTGYIASSFAEGMQTVADAELTAVVSRSENSAAEFANKYGGRSIYTDFDLMLSEVKPDVVYIAIPNDLHYGYILRALNAGINVLSEKPMVDTVKQMDELYALAESKNLFLMEGMWTRCFPVVRKVREWIDEGRIGKPLTVDVCFDIKPDYSSWQTWKAGIEHSAGALRDVGIYSLAVANMVFPEEPLNVSTSMHSNGEVDDMFRLFLEYSEGRTAFAGGAFNQNSDHVARIIGSEGSITFGPEFWHPHEALLKNNNGACEGFDAPYTSSGFQYEIKAVQNAIRNGLIECPDYTHAESRVIGRIIENARRSRGIIYKADEQ